MQIYIYLHTHTHPTVPHDFFVCFFVSDKFSISPLLALDESMTQHIFLNYLHQQCLHLSLCLACARTFLKFSTCVSISYTFRRRRKARSCFRFSYRYTHSNLSRSGYSLSLCLLTIVLYIHIHIRTSMKFSLSFVRFLLFLFFI